jgi:hypothetical protein
MGYTKEQREANALKKMAVGEAEKVSPTVSTETRKCKTKPQLPLDMLVEVQNGFNGKLIYKSKKNLGYRVIFNNFGDFEYMELSELVAAKNSQPKFFSKNWFLIDDQEVIDYLRVEKYYENSLSSEDISNFFEMSIDEIKKKIGRISDGQKQSIIYRAQEMVDSGEIDSRKKIEALEEALGVQLTEI